METKISHMRGGRVFQNGDAYVNGQRRGTVLEVHPDGEITVAWEGKHCGITGKRMLPRQERLPGEAVSRVVWK